jgi:Flp pilus assembly protein TadD
VATLAGIVVVAGALTWNRSQVWSSQVALWSDAVEKTPQKPRTHLGLGTAEFIAGRYGDAIRQYKLAESPQYARDGTFYRQWALALVKAGRFDEAVSMGRKAALLNPTAPTYQVLGEAVALKGDDIREAVDLLGKAQKIDPDYEPVYIDLGNIFSAIDRHQEACAAYQRAWTLDPQDPSAAKGLAVCAGPSGQPGQR